MTPTFTWADILDHWNVVQLDLHERYGVDCGDRQLMAGRPWSWLQLRIQGLLATDSRLDRALRG